MSFKLCFERELATDEIRSWRQSRKISRPQQHVMAMSETGSQVCRFESASSSGGFKHMSSKHAAAPLLTEIHREVVGTLVIEQRIRKHPALLNMLTDTLRQLANAGITDRTQLTSCALRAGRKLAAM